MKLAKTHGGRLTVAAVARSGGRSGVRRNRFSFWVGAIAALIALGSIEARADLTLTDLQWNVQNIVDNDDAPFGLGQGPGDGRPRSVRGLALSPDGQYAYLGYNQAKEVRKIDLSVADPADSCAAVAELYFGTLSVAEQSAYTGTYLPDALDNPKAIATDDVGRVYVTRSSEIQIYDANLTTLLLAITGFSTTNGIHVARRDGTSFYVYAADRGTPTVYRMIVTEAAIGGGGSVAMGTVLDTSFDGDGIVDVGTDAFGATANDLRGLAADASGTVWAAENDGTLFEIVPAAGDGASTIDKRMLAGAFDVAIEGDQVFVTSSGRTVTVVDRNDINTILDTLTPPISSLDLAATGSATGIDLLPGAGILMAIEEGSSAPQSSESSFSDVNCSGPDPNDYADDDNDPILLALQCPTTRYVSPTGADGGNDCRDSLAPCATIQHAIDVACPAGDTIQLEADTYDEGPQILVDKDVTLAGAGKSATVVRPVGDTSASGDGRGWFLVPSGVTFDVRDLTLDGSGHLVYQAIRNAGAGGTVDSVRFTEIKYNESGPTYGGVAIAAFGTGPVDVTNSMFDEIGRVGVLYYGSGISGSTFSGNMYTGKGTGDFLDYMLDISAGANVTVTGNTVSGNRGVASSDSSNSAGVLISTYYGSGTNATVDGNLFDDNTNGVVVGYKTSGCPGPDPECDTSTASVSCNLFTGNDNGVSAKVEDGSLVVAEMNSFVGNTEGVDGGSVFGGSVDAADNWWGAADGPSGAGSGSGDAVTANVTFSPFATAPPPCVSCTQNSDCDDGLICNGAETCNTGTGMCVAGTSLDCSSADDQCNAGLCTEPAGACVPDPLPDGTACSTGVTCSVQDTCSSGTCVANSPDSDGDGVCDANERAGFSLRKVRLKERPSGPNRDLWIAIGELDTTSSPGDFINAVTTTGVEIVLFHDGGLPLTQVDTLTFTAAQCTERHGSVKCKDPATRSRALFRKRSAPDFFKVKIKAKKRDFALPALADTPLSVNLRTTEAATTIDRSDQIGSAGCSLRGTTLKCRDVP